MSESKQSLIRKRNDPGDRVVLRKSERTRILIVENATKFLWTHPFRELTVGGLMSQAGTSRSAFYQYFSDLHDLLETLLQELESQIFDVARPWFLGDGEPMRLLNESLSGLVRVCYQHGPIVRAVSEAAPMDARLEKAWTSFLSDFDNAVAKRIEQHQAAGLIQPFEARSVAIALNRMNASMVVHHFGRRPRSNPSIVHETMSRVWTSTLYGVGDDG